MKSNPRFIISGGGTGGHIYPAIAIGNALKEKYPDASFLFVGAQDKMEMQKVPQAGFQIEGLWISGIQRKLTVDNLKFPLKLVSSLWKSRKIVKRFKPDVVIGTGGFASGAVLQVANSMNIPTLVQEQNSYPGITNKLLSKKAAVICVAYPGLERFFPSEKIILTGNPVRSDLLNTADKRAEALQFFNLDPNKKTLVVLGGSLGARKINQLLAANKNWLLEQNIQILWQCGKFYFEEYAQHAQTDGVQVLSFIDRMDLVYAAADLIISRSGASSVSELALVGKPTIFIPSPNVAEDHQTKNAKAIVDQGGAVLLREATLEETFQPAIKEIVNNTAHAMSLGANFKKLALPNATTDIVSQIEQIIKNIK